MRGCELQETWPWGEAKLIEVMETGKTAALSVHRRLTSPQTGSPYLCPCLLGIDALMMPPSNFSFRGMFISSSS